MTAEQIMAMPPDERPSQLDRYRRNGYIIVDPPIDKSRLDPALPGCLVSQSSLDVEMGDAYRFYEPQDDGDSPVLRISDKTSMARFENHCTKVKSIGSSGLRIQPGGFVLAKTQRFYFLPVQLQAHIWGRSRVGRCGIQVHLTAPRIDPGFAGQIVLEIVNHNHVPVILDAGFAIAQLEFERVCGDTGIGYAESRPGSGLRQSIMRHALAPGGEGGFGGPGVRGGPGFSDFESDPGFVPSIPWIDAEKL